MTKLTWSDLILDDLGDPAVRCAEMLGFWKWLLAGTVGPHAISKFGDWFFQRPDGSIHMLDVVQGEVRPIAKNHGEFMQLVNTQQWQEHNLLSNIVWQLHEKQLIAGKYQAYALIVHPLLGGKIDCNNVKVMDMYVWQCISSQLVQQLNGGA